MESDETTFAGRASLTPPTMTREQVTAFFARRQKAYEDLDAAALAADYAPDAVIQSPTAGVHDGHAAEVALRAVFRAFLDMTLTTDVLIIDGDRAAQGLTIRATHAGEFLGLAPTGRPFRLTAVFLYELRDGKIVREQRIYDFTGMLVQIGVLRAKPV
jgi:predicted ester cyclase